MADVLGLGGFMSFSILMFVCVAIAMEAVREPAAQKNEPQPALLEKLPTKHVPNAIKVHPKVISGGLPEGEKR